jgi:hypothetical protein
VNNHPGAIRLLRAQDRYDAAQTSIGQPHAHGLDFNVLTVAKIVFLPQLRKRVGQGSHALATIVFDVRISQERHGLSCPNGTARLIVLAQDIASARVGNVIKEQLRELCSKPESSSPQAPSQSDGIRLYALQHLSVDSAGTGEVISDHRRPPW